MQGHTVGKQSEAAATAVAVVAAAVSHWMVDASSALPIQSAATVAAGADTETETFLFPLRFPQTSSKYLQGIVI